MSKTVEAVVRLANHYPKIIKISSEKLEFRSLDADWPQMNRVLDYIFNGIKNDSKQGILFLTFVETLTVYWDVRGMANDLADWSQRAIDLCIATDNRLGEANHLRNKGNAHRYLAQIDQAIDYYHQALFIHREIGDRHNEANDLGNLGVAYSDIANKDEAIGYYQQALKIHQEIGDRRSEGNYWANLGAIYHDFGQVEDAFDFYQKALGSFDISF